MASHIVPILQRRKLNSKEFLTKSGKISFTQFSRSIKLGDNDSNVDDINELNFA